jgi:hypothetical protein
MESEVLAIHPIIQFLSIVLALYVFYLGVQRFRVLHLEQQAVFPWKRHVTLGEIALTVMLAGMIGGMILVYIYWHGFLILGIHGKLGIVMAAFIIFGLATGIYMNRQKRNSRGLVFIHGLNNLIILIFSVLQVITGWGLLRMFLFGE